MLSLSEGVIDITCSTGVILTGSNHPSLLMSRQGSEEVAVVRETHPLGSILPLLSPRHVAALGQAQSHFSNTLSNAPPGCTAHHHDCFGSAVAVQGLHLGSSPSRALGNVYHV